ncbi:MAG: AraC family transcriptional regulator [Nocardiopsaceae bacterium]|nr:AraC family transcriptional regulator [Nocardiopsaceae bacterium]
MSVPHGDLAHYWRHPGLPGVELLKARFVRYAFTRHTHETYTIGVIEDGVEEYDYRGQTHRVGAGGIALAEPHEVHTGHAGTPSGWRYRVLYPSVAAMTEAAQELGLTAPPSFPQSAIDDPETANALRAAHMATERGDRLSASSLTRDALVRLIRRHAHRSGKAAPQAGPAGSGTAAAARDLLQADLADPPTLGELATAVGSTPYALLRAFRAAYGLPPHAYLNQARVHRACGLLREGGTPGEVAAHVGFADQSHLTRHFKRHTGVTPGVFRQGVLVDGQGDPVD